MYLESRTKRIFAIAFLGKKLVFHTEICEYFEYLISKIGHFHRVRELFKSNQTGYGVYHGQVESKTKIILAIACLGKKFVFHSENIDIRLLFAYFIFKNIEILSGQGVVLIKPNLVCSIPCVPQV